MVYSIFSFYFSWPIIVIFGRVNIIFAGVAGPNTSVWVTGFKIRVVLLALPFPTLLFPIRKLRHLFHHCLLELDLLSHELIDSTNILMDIDVGGFAAFPFLIRSVACNLLLALRSMMSVGSTPIFFAQFSLLIGFLWKAFLRNSLPQLTAFQCAPFCCYDDPLECRVVPCLVGGPLVSFPSGHPWPLPQF